MDCIVCVIISSRYLLPFPTSHWQDPPRVTHRCFCIPPSSFPHDPRYEHGQSRPLSPRPHSYPDPHQRQGHIDICRTYHESQMSHNSGNPTRGMENPELYTPFIVADRVSDTSSQYTHLLSKTVPFRRSEHDSRKSRKISEALLTLTVCHHVLLDRQRNEQKKTIYSSNLSEYYLYMISLCRVGTELRSDPISCLIFSIFFPRS